MKPDFLELLHALHRAKVQVLGLEAIIESKMAANRDKDQAMLPVLRRTLQEK